MIAGNTLRLYDKSRLRAFQVELTDEQINSLLIKAYGIFEIIDKTQELEVNYHPGFSVFLVPK